MIGQTLGHYRVLEKIGAGGMGEVYRAHDENLDRDVALKVLPTDSLTDPTARTRLIREARTASKLNHPHICTIHEVGEEGSQAYIAMEYVHGRPLSQLLERGALPVETILRYGEQLADALTHAHDRNVIHRDLKSANVVITPENRVKILDFGLAKLVRPLPEGTSTESISQTAEVVGTLPYMAPEQLRGEKADARTDLWALGVVLYEMATGHHPFAARLATALAADIQYTNPLSPARWNPKLPSRLEDSILKCLEKNPENRYQSAKELAVDLRRLGQPSLPGVSWHQKALRRPWPRAALLLGLALIGLLVGLNMGGLRQALIGGRSPPGPIDSLAVLPLENLSTDSGEDYFVDGMTEALIADLAKISALRVISRTSVMQYKGVKKPLPEIARELNVDAVIEGSVLRAGDRVRITAQLIEAASDRHLWAESYERDLRDILALQREVARAIAREINIALSPQEQARLASSRPVKPEAYQLYLKGRYQWNRRTRDGFERALQYFEQALARDPDYPLAYVGLADTYSLLANYGFVSPTEAFPQAKAAAMKALEKDDTLGEAYTSLGFTFHHYDWDWLAAEDAYRQAVQLNPGYGTAHQWYAEYLATVGRDKEAMAQIRHARSLDPLSLAIDTNVGRLLYYMGRFDEAIQELRWTTELAPKFPWARLFLAMAYEQKQEYEKALAEAEILEQLSGGGPTTILARIYAGQGRKARARKVLVGLMEDGTDPYFVAGVYASLGENDQAIAWLRKAIDERSFFVAFLEVDPWFKPLRSDRRFLTLLDRLDFPQSRTRPESLEAQRGYPSA